MSVNLAPAKESSRVFAKDDPFEQLSRLLDAKYPAGVSAVRYRLSDLSILTKQQKIVRFTPNSVQSQYLEALGLDPDTTAVDLAGLRELILKARQFGFSTLIIGLLFLNTINCPNTNTVVIAHDLESTEKLFRIVNRFYSLLPAGKPVTQYASKREIFWPALNSRISILTAGKGTAGRGDTINNLHMSEWAFWDDEEVVTGLLQAVPAGGNIFAESTANGRGNQFHVEYQLSAGKIEQAKDGRTGSAFSAHFFPWHWHEEYCSEPPADFEPNEEEAALQALYKLTLGQLQWRREKLLEPGMGSMFPQEYPGDDEEAFRVSGGVFFDTFQPKPPFVVPPKFLPGTLPQWYNVRIGLDWGFADPFAWAISAIDEYQRKHVVESYEEARLTNEAQADNLKAACARWGIPIQRALLIADASMWYRKTINGVQFPPDIEAYMKAGFVCTPADHGDDANRHRNSAIRGCLADQSLIIYQGYNTRLIECLENAKHDPRKREQVLHDESSHLVYALGCAIGSYASLQTVVDPDAPPYYPPPVEKEPDHRPQWLKRKSTKARI